MAKAIYFSTEAVEVLSNYANTEINKKAYYAYSNELKAEIEDTIKDQTAVKIKLQEALIEAIDSGVSFDTAKAQFSTAECEGIIAQSKKELARLSKARKEEGKAFKEATNEAIKPFNLPIADIYAAYALGVQKADYSACGKVEIVTSYKKGSPQKETFVVKRGGLYGLVKDWLKTMQCQNADNDKAVDRFIKMNVATFIKVNDATPGSKNSYNVDGEYKTPVSKSDLVHSLIKALLHASLRFGYLEADPNNSFKLARTDKATCDEVASAK